MGLIKAIAGAFNGVMADQWKEFFYCDAIDSDILVTKGMKRTSGRSSNTKGSENVITNGSVISVADGQCMIIVDQGKVAEVCAEPGEFKYDSSTEPSIFSGSLGTSIIDTFKTIGKRFTYGGDTGKDQRVYYFNTKEIVGNKYGTATPIPFRVVDEKVGLDIDISIRCNGEYSYKITNPILFYTNVCGNVEFQYNRSEIDSMLKSELMTALQPAFAKISDMGIRYYSVTAHTQEISDALNEILSEKWGALRGIEVASFGVNTISAPKEDEDMIKDIQRKAVYRNASMAGATLVDAQAEAMKSAAKNEGQGSFMAFAGMNMAQNAGGMNPADFFNMSNQQQAQQTQQTQQTQAPTNNEDTWACSCGATNTGKFCMECGSSKPAPVVADSWTCNCGATNTGKFCMECGTPKPAEVDGWTCSCGVVNKGKFCMECGNKKPADEPLYKCDKCGWEPADPKNPPKFCPECGDLFNEDDVQ